MNNAIATLSRLGSSWVMVDCPLCDAYDFEMVYSSQQETGDFMERITVQLMVCNGCGFVLQNPQLSSMVLNRYYTASNAASGSVYHDVGHSSVYGKRQQDRVRFFMPYLAKHSNVGELLEIGCATGDFLLALQLDGWSLHGIEPSMAAAEQARQMGIRVINATLGDEATIIEAEHYDAVCLFSVLEHLSKPQQALEAIANALKPGGMCCLEVPDTMKPIPQLAEFFGYEHLWHFTRNTFEMFMRRWGFDGFVYDDTVTDSRLRVIGFKVGVTAKPLLNDRDNIVPVLVRYQTARSALVSAIAQKLERQMMIWKASQRRVAIYGAGVHTRFLMDAVDIFRDIDMILDSDPKKRGTPFMRWTVEDESAISRGLVDCVIISSKAFEDEIYRRLLSYVSSHGIELVKCYSDED